MDDAPSLEAWNLLMAVRTSPKICEGFWAKVVSDALSNDIDRNEEGPKGRKIQKMIDDMLTVARNIPA